MEFRLIQEDYSDDPWKVMVCCICLNLTSGRVARGIIAEIFDRWPDAKQLSKADELELACLIKPLGLYNRRCRSLRRFSEDYMRYEKKQIKLDQCHGIGTYALEAYKLVCLNDTSFEPHDKELKRRWKDLTSTS